ncbi:MAG: hypothetical protein OXG16_11495 [Rhodospirillales bacterium]|nr:hypothetical protein [Rhodospirillales bacterium]MDE0712948.1 hypothetical protein [Rhodospirillales bacterium]
MSVISDIAELHHGLRKTPYQANRTLGALSKMFNLVEAWGLCTDGGNPCRFVQTYKEKRRERFLPEEEFARLGRVLVEVETEGAETPVAACGRWLVNAIRLGAPVAVPEIADYEVQRELIRTCRSAGIAARRSHRADRIPAHPNPGHAPSCQEVSILNTTNAYRPKAS